MSNRKIYTDSLAEELKADAGRKWRPSNDTDGELFMFAYCNRCKHDASARAGTGNGCKILWRSWLYDVDDPPYPPEWQIDVDGQPTCTAFEEDHDVQQD